MKPGACALPHYGIHLAILDAVSGRELHGNNVEGVLAVKSPWPSIARTIYGDHDRYLNVYTRPYPGYYFTGDGLKYFIQSFAFVRFSSLQLGCRRDADGFYWITGRVDDVINPSGHRLGTAEIESALVACPEVSEAAVVGFPHETKGDGIGCFVIVKDGVQPSAALRQKLTAAVREAIGPIATPDFIIFSDLPKVISPFLLLKLL